MKYKNFRTNKDSNDKKPLGSNLATSLKSNYQKSLSFKKIVLKKKNKKDSKKLIK